MLMKMAFNACLIENMYSRSPTWPLTVVISLLRVQLHLFYGYATPQWLPWQGWFQNFACMNCVNLSKI